MKKFTRIFLTSLLALLIIAAGLIIGGAWEDLQATGDGDPMRGYFSDDMPNFPGSSPAPLGKDLNFNDLPMEVAYFETEAAVAEVRDYYLNAFKKMSLMAHYDGGPGGAVVYGHDLKKKTQRLVAIQRQGARTFVFPSIMPMLAMPSLDPAKAGGVFVVPGAVGYSAVSSREYGKASRMVAYQSPRDSAETASLITEGMKKLGWVPGTSADMSGGSQMLDFTSESGRASVMVMNGRAGGAAVLMNVQGGVK
jgi:hypothetical protein